MKVNFTRHDLDHYQNSALMQEKEFSEQNQYSTYSYGTQLALPGFIHILVSMDEVCYFI